MRRSLLLANRTNSLKTVPYGETWDKVSIAFFEDTYDLYINDTLVFGTDRSDTNKEGVLLIGFGGSGEAKAKLDNFVL